MTGTAAEIIASFGNSTITEATNVAITVNSGTASLSQARTIDGYTTGVVTATIADTRVSDLVGSSPLLDANSNNAFTVTIGTADAEITAANLTTLNGLTSVAIEAGNVTKITGTVAATNTVYAAAGNSEINGLGNEAVVISGESSNTLSDASTLNTLDGYTTGTVNAGSLTTVKGDLSDLLTAYASNGITGLGNEAITLDDTSSVSSTDLNTLDSKTSGDITTHSSLATLTGTVAALNTAYSSEGIKVLGNEKVTVSDTTLDAGDLNVLNNYTTGLVTASAATTLRGTLADVNEAYAAVAVSGDAITGLADEAVELTDTRVLAADLKTLNTKTTGTIDASTISVIEGTASDVNTVYDAAGSSGDKVSGLGSEEITLTDTTVSATALRNIYLDGSTVRNSGTIDASSVHTISGSGTTISIANTVYASGRFTGLGSENITITDQGASGAGNGVSVSDLNTLNGYTTGNVNAGTITFLEGSISNLNTAYAATSALGNGISGLANETVTITDTSEIDASALNTLNGYTTGNVVATTATSFTGTISDLNTLYAASTGSGNGISGLGSEAATVTDSSVSASDLNTLDTKTNYNITVNATTISGSLSDLNTLYGAKASNGDATTDGFTGLGAETVTLTDTGSIASSTLLTVAQANASGTLDASTAGTITGTATQIKNAYADETITEASNVAININSGTVSLSLIHI